MITLEGILKTEPFTISPARYAKDQFVVQTPSDGSGYKTEIMWLIEACGGRWVHRSKGYHLSARQVKNFKKLHATGWRGCVRLVRWETAMFTKDGIHKFRLADALVRCAV